MDMTDLVVARRAVAQFQPGLVWIETPSNPRLHITDIAAVTRIAHDVGALATG